MKLKFSLFFLLVVVSISGFCQSEWMQIDVPHTDSSYFVELDVPDANSVWGAFSIKQNYSISFAKSADGGATWTTGNISAVSSSLFTSISNLIPLNADTCFATINSSNDTSTTGIYKTTDGGISWSKIGAGLIYTSFASFPDFTYFWNANQGVTVGDGDFSSSSLSNFEIYTTNNGGTSWSRVPVANLPATEATPFSLTNGYTVRGNRIWFFGSNYITNKIYRSDDYGTHWTSYNIPFSDPDLFTFTDTLHGYGIETIGGIQMLYTSIDGGATWSSGMPYTRHQKNVSHITNIPGTSTIVTASNEGTAYSTDNGLTWTPMDSINHTGDIKFFNTLIGWSGQYRNKATDLGGIYKLISTVLPIKFISFTASMENKAALLSWSTSDEINNKGFYVERSSNGANFNTVGFVKANSGNGQISHYNYTDDNIYGTNIWYYRLRQIDIDGQITFSSIIKFEQKENVHISISPNPVKEKLSVQLSGLSGKVEISIYNSNGVQVIQNHYSNIFRTLSIPVDRLQRGIYFVKLINGGVIQQCTFIKQ